MGARRRPQRPASDHVVVEPWHRLARADTRPSANATTARTTARLMTTLLAGSGLKPMGMGRELSSTKGGCVMVRLRTLAFGVVCAAAGVAAPVALSGGTASGRGHPEALASWWRPPADVRHMLARISPAKLRRDDLKLVSFGTRHTLSSQTDPNRGIGAARDWIKR